jgi:hypothetical protein
VRRSSITLALTAGLTAALLLPASAHARRGSGGKNQPKRKGGQAELLAGASACIPGRGDCKADGLGRTAPSFGMAFDLGWRAHRTFFIGGGYSVGWFNPTWELDNQAQFRSAFQQGVFGILRAYIPIWRIDIGFEVAPGWSRQTFVAASGNDRTYTQGFALRPGLSFDIWLGRRLFVGAKLDTIFNFHRELCVKTRSERNCTIEDAPRQSRVHQLIGGLHIGGTF